MKNLNYIALAGVALLSLSAVSCKNADTDFPDHQDGVSAYFANQYPVKVITIGEDPEQDNTLDNKHQFNIFATQGGAYKSRDLKIGVQVDPTLCLNLSFPDGSPVKVMPESYYELETTTLYKKQDFLFGTTVTLTDAFFADPDAVKETYVIPLVMTSAQGADRILTGTPVAEGDAPLRTNSSAWSVQPQDFVLFGVKFINEWTGSYLRRGVDKITENGATTASERKADFVENDEVVFVTTKSLRVCNFPVSTVVPDGESVKTLTCDLTLTFNGDECTVSTTTPGMTATGTGKWVKDGEKKSWGNEDRDALYLNYTVDYGSRQVTTEDVLVMRHREVAPIFNFNPVYNN